MQFFDIYWFAVWIAAFGSFLVSLLFYRHRRQRENFYAAFMMLACGLWALAAGSKFFAVSWQGVEFWVTLEYMVAASIGFFFLAFVAELTGYRSFSRISTLILSYSPVLIHFLLFHMGFLLSHGPSMQGEPLTRENIINSHVGITTWYHAVTFYAYLPFGVAVVLLIVKSLKVLGFYRTKYLLILAVSVVPLLLDSFSKTGAYPLVDVELAPLLFPISGVLILFALRMFRALSILPVEYQHLLNGLPSGLLYLSSDKKLIEWNDACEELLGLNSSHLGAPVSDLPFECLADAIEKSVNEQCIRCGHPVQKGRTLEVRSTSLQVRQGFTGYVVYIEDATERIESELRQNALQAEIKAGRDQLDSIFHASSNLQALVDESGTIIRINKAFIAFTNLKNFSDPAGKHISQFFHSSAAAEITRMVELVSKSRTPQSVELSTNGHDLITEVHPLQDSTDFLLTGTDITQLRKAEWENNQTVQLHQILIARAQDGIFFLVSDLLTFVNDAVARIVGYTAEEMIGKEFSGFVYEADRERVFTNYKRRIQGLPVDTEYELRLKHRSGKPVDVNMTVGTVEMNGKIATIGTLKDITVQKKALLALKESEEKYRRIFENAHDVFFQINISGIITAISPSVKQLLGYLVIELVGKSVIDFYYSMEERIELLALLEKSGSVSDHELRMRKKGGQPVFVF